jgi:hypothetical protein
VNRDRQSTMKHRLIASGIGLFVIVAVVGGVVYWQWPGVLPVPVVGPPPAEAVPTFSWNPRSVSEVIGQGQTKTIQVSFTASEDVSDVVVRVVPELGPYLTVSPTAFAHLVAGEATSLGLTVTLRATPEFGLIRGTVQLRNKRGATLSRPLSVTLRDLRSEPFAGLEVSPTTINASVPTSIRATIPIPDADLLPSDVTLHRVDKEGRVLIDLRALRDDGQDGDLVAGDGRYSALVGFDESTEGVVALMASARFHGQLHALTSSGQTISVLPFIADTGPEEFMRRAASMFKTAASVEEIVPLIHPNMEESIRQLLEDGVPLSDIGETLERSRLAWKRPPAAVFVAEIEAGPGEVFGISIVLEEFAGEWKIVSF